MSVGGPARWTSASNASSQTFCGPEAYANGTFEGSGLVAAPFDNVHDGLKDPPGEASTLCPSRAVANLVFYFYVWVLRKIPGRPCPPLGSFLPRTPEVFPGSRVAPIFLAFRAFLPKVNADPEGVPTEALDAAVKAGVAHMKRFETDAKMAVQLLKPLAKKKARAKKEDSEGED